MSVKTISCMIEWVEDNIGNEPTLDKMADFVGYSEFYCSAKFHEYVGIPFRRYVAHRQLSLAAASLRESDQRIIDIALQYGFSSHEAFTRAFGRAYGCTPGRYRMERPDIPIYEKARID